METCDQFLMGTPAPPKPHLVNGFITSILQAQVHHGVLQSAAHVELQGQVVNALGMQSETLTHSTLLSPESLKINSRPKCLPESGHLPKAALGSCS